MHNKIPTDTTSASQQTLYILCNPQLQCCHHNTLLHVTLIQSVPSNPISVRCTIILSSHLPLGPPSGLLRFPIKIQYAVLLFPTYATCPANPNLLHFSHPNNISRSALFRKHLFMQFSPVTPVPNLPPPNVFLSTLFLNTLTLCSSLSVTDQVSYPYKTTTSKFTVMHILISILFDSKWVGGEKKKIPDQMVARNP